MAKNSKPSRLYIVGLPIGNPADLSPRARLTLQDSNRIFCEDTRKSLDFFERAQLKVSAKLSPLPAQQEREMPWSKEFQKAQDEIWAVISDAGTPVVNDPGFYLTQACHQAGVPVVAIPGACAPILAWQWSGGFGLPFHFAGFVPKAKSTESKSLSDFFYPASQLGGTFCFFDTKHQIEKTLDYLSKHPIYSLKKLFIARELTKEHEELIAGTPQECLEKIQSHLKKTKGALGEITLLLEAHQDSAPKQNTLDLDLLKELRAAPPRAAAKIMAEISGLSVNECYKKLQET